VIDHSLSAAANMPVLVPEPSTVPVPAATPNKGLITQFWNGSETWEYFLERVAGRSDASVRVPRIIPATR